MVLYAIHVNSLLGEDRIFELKSTLKGKKWERTDWIELALDRDKWRILVNMPVKTRCP
jgi:hypothetical protein